MNPLWPALRRITADLGAAQARWALVGGLAVGSRTEPRFTRDVDIAVAVADDPEAERLVNVLIGRGYRVLSQLEQESTGRLATLRLLPPLELGAAGVVDLLFATCGIEQEIVAGAESRTIALGLSVPVARAEHLIAMKILSHRAARPQDRIDLVNLIRDASEAELRRARDATRLIVERGAARGRDLVASFDELLRELGRDAATR